MGANEHEWGLGHLHTHIGVMDWFRIAARPATRAGFDANRRIQMFLTKFAPIRG